MAPPTDRQLQIAELRNKGLTQEQIAEKLGIARSTVARDWLAVKAELSYLPLDYREPTVIEPENKPDLSSSIVVRLSGPDFEKFRKSEILYSKNVNGEVSVFEARSNNIVHSTLMGKVPAKYYLALSKLSIEHHKDCLDIMAKAYDLFRLSIGLLKPVRLTSLDAKGSLSLEQKTPTSLSRSLTSAFWQKSFSLNDREIQRNYFDQATLDWEEVFRSHAKKSIENINRLFTTKLTATAYELYNEAKPCQVVDLVLNSFESLIQNQDTLIEAKKRLGEHQKTLPHIFNFYHDTITKKALLDEGIKESDLHIAAKHGISEPQTLNEFLQSGAISIDEYNKLKSEGFETLQDQNEFNEMLRIWNRIRRILSKQRARIPEDWHIGEDSTFVTAGLKYNHLRTYNWTTERMLVAEQLLEKTWIFLDFKTGYLHADVFADIAIPTEENLRILVKKIGLENLPSWLLPTYDSDLVMYAISSPHTLKFEHARATFEALQKNEHIFPGLGGKLHLEDSFIQKYGLAWANSDLDPYMYVVLDIVRKSHGKQIPLSNLQQKLEKTFKALPGNLRGPLTLINAINEQLGQYCVVQPNEIVQIKGRKKQPVDTETAFEQFKEERQPMIEDILKQNQSLLNTDGLARTLGVKIEQLPDFFSRVDEEEINAIRLCRVIRDDDLPQACQLVWRYFVNKVSPFKPESENEEDEYVHDIDFASEHLGLNKSQVNLLHDVRKIRNDVEHPSTDKATKPTWKKVAGVLKICELF